MRARGTLKWVTAWVLPLLLGACAGLPRDASLPVSDPHESANRQVMAANQEALRPASEFVKTAVPGPVHDRLHDFNSNLKEPRILVNNVLQGRFDAAAKTTTRFVVNSVLGFGGLVDFAGNAGLTQQSGDFGQTLFVWGVPEGPYVVQPYLGPGTTRDAVGAVVDLVANPVNVVLGPATAATVGPASVDAVDRLGQLKMAEDASIDFYSFIRSSYYQMRRNELREALGQPATIDSPALDDPDAPATAIASTPVPDSASAPAAPGASHSAETPATKRASAAPAKTRSAAAPATKRSASAPAANKPMAAANASASHPPAAVNRSASEPEPPAVAAGHSALLAE